MDELTLAVCPKCLRPAGPLTHVNRIATDDYYRCNNCALVWTHEKNDPNSCAVLITPYPQDPNESETATPR